MSAVCSPLPPSSSCLDSYLGADGKNFLSALALPSRDPAPCDWALSSEVQGTFSSCLYVSCFLTQCRPDQSLASVMGPVNNYP